MKSVEAKYNYRKAKGRLKNYNCFVFKNIYF